MTGTFLILDLVAYLFCARQWLLSHGPAPATGGETSSSRTWSRHVAMKKAFILLQAFFVTWLANLECAAWTASHGIHVALVAFGTLGCVYSHLTIL